MARTSRTKRYAVKAIGLILIVIIMAVVIFRNPHTQKLIYPYPYRSVIEHFATEYGVDPLLVVAVIREESKFIPASESHKGAQGLMQLMPDTAAWIAVKIGDEDYTLESLREPEKNIQYGTWYLANLEKEFKNNRTLTLAAYNGGRGRVNEWIRTEQLKLTNLQITDIPFEETREYVVRVLRSYEMYRTLYQK